MFESMSSASMIKKYKQMPVQIRASFWFLIASFLQRGISVITTPIFTRLLSTSEYGHFNVFVSWQDILKVIVILYLPWGVYEQGIVKFDDQKKTFTSSLLGLGTTLVLIWTGIYLFFRGVLNNLLGLSTPQMIAMLLMIWTSAGFNFWAIQQRVQYKYRALALLTVLTSIAKPTVGIILVLTCSDKVTARIIGLAAVELAIYLGVIVKQFMEGHQFFSAKIWKYGLWFNIPLIPHYLSQTVLNSADRIMIKKMVGAGEAGIYSLAYSVSLIMTLVNTALLQTVGPWVYQRIRAKEFSRISQIAYPVLVGVAAVNLILISFAPEAVRIFAPAKYYPAIWVIPPVAMSVYFMFMYSLFANIEFYYEKTKMISAATMVGAGLNLILNYVFIKQFGYYAAGYTTLFCYMLYALMHYLFMRSIMKNYEGGTKVYSVRVLFGITVSFIITGFLLMLTYNYPIVRYSCITIGIVAIVIMRRQIMKLIKAMLEMRK